MKQSATSYHSQGLLRALEVLKLLGTADNPMSLAELSGRLRVPKPTLLRLLAVLEEQEFIYREGVPPVYAVGHAVLQISETYRRQANVAEIAGPYLRRLADTTGFTANLGVLEGPWVLHICVEEPDRPLRFRSSSGSLDHTHCTGLGKMLLSRLRADGIDSHLTTEPFEKFTPFTLVAREDLESEIARIRSRGYSIDRQERDMGVTCMAVPILTATGINVALSVAGSSGEFTTERQDDILPELFHGAAQLSADGRFVASLMAQRRGRGGAMEAAR